MGLPKGRTNNPKGRPKGTRNLTTEETKEILTGILKKNFTAAKVDRDLMKLEPRQRLDVLTKLLSYVLPRPTEGNVNMNLNLENLPENDLDFILQKLIENSHEN